MKYSLSIALALLCLSCVSINTDIDSNTTKKQEANSYDNAKQGILNVMEAQETAWNKHDLEGFMDGYWKSDSLKFYGRKGLTYGWENTLANYKEGYPTATESGTLDFVINDISKIEGNTYWVMGEYHLKRKIGDANGVFMIVFKKINGQWKIIADMSC